MDAPPTTTATTNFLLLARGASLETARVLAVSADQRLVDKFVAELAGKNPIGEEPIDDRESAGE